VEYNMPGRRINIFELLKVKESMGKTNIGKRLQRRSK
jgi:hypothetical protein